MSSKKVSTSLIAATSLLFIVGSIGGYVFVTKDDNSDVPAPASLNENPEVKQYKKLEDEHQAKITTFDESKYTIPKSNLANKVELTKCVNGFGGMMPKLYAGVYSEPLYNLDAEVIPTNIEGTYGYSPYVNAYYVVGDILFRQPQDYFDRSLITLPQLTRNLTDTRVIIGDRSYKNSYQRMESAYGFPTAYVKQQSGNITTLSAFNNACVKGVGQREITFSKIELAGMPISSVFSSYYQTSQYHGANGLYSVTKSTPDFVGANFLEWLQSNNKIWLSLINDPERTVFPKGAVMYIPKNYNNKDEVLTVDLSDRVQGSLADWKKAVETQNYLTSGQVTYVEEKFKEYKILKAVTTLDMSSLGAAIAVGDKGDLHPVIWDLPVTKSIDGNEPQRSNLVMFNMPALKSIITLTKSRYQGAQLDYQIE